VLRAIKLDKDLPAHVRGRFALLYDNERSIFDGRWGHAYEVHEPICETVRCGSTHIRVTIDATRKPSAVHFAASKAESHEDAELFKDFPEQ
jgi:hypothetical protein